jgi:hypothetical protein
MFRAFRVIPWPIRVHLWLMKCLGLVLSAFIGGQMKSLVLVLDFKMICVHLRLSAASFGF